MSIEDVDAAVQAYNEAIANIGSGIDFDSLIGSLEEYANKLGEAWTTENGYYTVKGLNKVISEITEKTQSLKEAINSINNDRMSAAYTNEKIY